MGSKTNKELFLQHLKDAFGNKVELVSEYHGKEKKVQIIYHCEKHGDTVAWINAKNIFGLNFCPCKKCQTEKRSRQRHSFKDKQYFYNRLKAYCEKRGGEVIEKEWTKAKDIYHFKCSNPEHPIFESTADSIVGKKQWCPYCSGRKGDFEERINQIVTERGGEVVVGYKNSKTHMAIRCKKHNYIWEITPINLIKGRWCPVCSMGSTEKPVWEWLIFHGFNVISQYKFKDLIGDDGNPLRFDFGIIDKNNNLIFLLEVDDESHRSSSKCYAVLQKNDAIKNDYCKLHNIPLYRMPIGRWKITEKGIDWYRNYINEKLSYILDIHKKQIPNIQIVNHKNSEEAV